jgi:mannose-6-phosphate isomerase-like protein (cupin superfamily)
MFATKTLSENPDFVAPDGSDVRVLLQLSGGSVAHFALRPGAISKAIRHHTVDEIWYVLSGQGEMWRQGDGEASVVNLGSGVCITIPRGTSFQFRSVGTEELAAIGMTMPPWPGEGEALLVQGPWEASV